MFAHLYFEMTPAHVHDGQMLEQVLSGDAQWAFADMVFKKLLPGAGLFSQGVVQ